MQTTQFFQAMRVLTVTPAQAIEAVHDLTNGKGSGLFLFIDGKGGAEVLPCSVALA